MAATAAASALLAGPGTVKRRRYAEMVDGNDVDALFAGETSGRDLPRWLALLRCMG